MGLITIYHFRDSSTHLHIEGVVGNDNNVQITEKKEEHEKKVKSNSFFRKIFSKLLLLILAFRPS